MSSWHCLKKGASGVSIPWMQPLISLRVYHFLSSLPLVENGGSQLGLAYGPMRKECFRANLWQGCLAER